MRIVRKDQSGEEEGEDGFKLFLDDKKYPPSSVVLELRAAQSILGLETYVADDLMESLGMRSEEGVLDLPAWLGWLHDTFSRANLWQEDVSMATSLGTRLFEAFATKGGSPYVPPRDTVLFSSLAVGLTFLCGGSPLEDKLMVALTMADGDSDGLLSFDEFRELLLSVLQMVTVCSKLAANKVGVL